jgi:isopentenyl-diphosphate delta-isomerase
MASASARLDEEVGLGQVPLEPVGVYLYRAPDPVSERVEHEYDHVLVGRVDGHRPNPDPDEVAALRWAFPDEIRHDIATEPWSYAPWLSGVITVWHAAAAEPPGDR